MPPKTGFGKRTRIEEFPTKGRGGQGVIAIQTSTRNGLVVAAVSVVADDEIMLITNRGTLVRTPVEGISLVGRNTQGVRLINVGDEEKLVGVEPIAEYAGNNGGDDDDVDEDNGDGDGAPETPDADV